jgi:NDP-sugar pyrophosphorylase family protein
VPSLVVLAGGAARRFGGGKQLAAVGPRGEAILDVLLERAAERGFTDAVVVTSAALETEMRSHLDRHPAPLRVDIALQPVPAGRAGPPGTAHAVLACADAVAGSFAVVNADDLYPVDAFETLADHLSGSDAHALVAFRMRQTLGGALPANRALIEVDDGSRLLRLRETSVTEAIAAQHGDEWVSMNMWGFHQSVLPPIARMVGHFMASGSPGEIGLPDVVDLLVRDGTVVQVLQCDQPCIGMTYPEDAEVVRQALL